MEFQTIPFSIVFILLVQAIWIVVIFGLVQHLVIRMIKRESLNEWLSFYVPLIRNIIWALFLVKVVFTFGTYQPLLVLFITSVSLALTWSILRDLVLGTIFRFQKGNIEGQEVRLNEFSGQVTKMGETKLSIVLKNGEVVLLPYQKLFTEVLIIPLTNKQIKAVSIILPIVAFKNIESIKKQIKAIVLASPWVVIKNGVIIELFNDENNERKIKISYSITIPAKGFVIEEELRSLLSKGSA